MLFLFPVNESYETSVLGNKVTPVTQTHTPITLIVERSCNAFIILYTCNIQQTLSEVKYGSTDQE